MQITRVNSKLQTRLETPYKNNRRNTKSTIIIIFAQIFMHKHNQNASSRSKQKKYLNWSQTMARCHIVHEQHINSISNTFHSKINMNLHFEANTENKNNTHLSINLVSWFRSTTEDAFDGSNYEHSNSNRARPLLLFKSSTF